MKLTITNEKIFSCIFLLYKWKISEYLSIKSFSKRVEFIFNIFKNKIFNLIHKNVLKITRIGVVEMNDSICLNEPVVNIFSNCNIHKFILLITYINRCNVLICWKWGLNIDKRWKISSHVTLLFPVILHFKLCFEHKWQISKLINSFCKKS